MRERSEIVVSTGSVDKAVRVVVKLPASLAFLSVPERQRIINDAMWQAAKAVDAHIATEEREGPQPVSVRRVSVA